MIKDNSNNKNELSHSIRDRYSCIKCNGENIKTTYIGDMYGSVLLGECDDCGEVFTIKSDGDFNGL